MLLVDALSLYSPGGNTLLKYLYKNLIQRGITTYFLWDIRLEKEFSSNIIMEKTFLKSTIKNRKLFYLQHKSNFTRVLCFCNFPPPIRLSVPVYMFFQNVLLLQDCRYLSIKSRIFNYLKRQLVFYNRNNSNTWIDQTGLMKQLLMKKLRIPSKLIEVMPFFSLSDQMEPILSSKNPDSFIYPSTGIGHKNHVSLLKAWELLNADGYHFELHLTISNTDKKLIKLITSLKSKGLKIVNHGIVDQNELLSLYKSSEYLGYPSLNESFGLPLIEAIQQNCKVIAADLPYSKETIIPTTKFDPYQPSSLKNAIIEATLQKDNEKKSMIITKNKIDSLIELLNTPICS